MGDLVIDSRGCGMQQLDRAHEALGDFAQETSIRRSGETESYRVLASRFNVAVLPKLVGRRPDPGDPETGSGRSNPIGTRAQTLTCSDRHPR